MNAIFSDSGFQFSCSNKSIRGGLIVFVLRDIGISFGFGFVARLVFSCVWPNKGVSRSPQLPFEYKFDLKSFLRRNRDLKHQIIEHQFFSQMEYNNTTGTQTEQK